MSSISSQHGDLSGHSTPLSKVSSTFPRLATPNGQQRYSCYIDPSTSVADRVAATFKELEIDPERERWIRTILAPLETIHGPTYEHCLRVGLLARSIAQHENSRERTLSIGQHEKLDQKALFYAGIMHDCGKARCPVALLDKTGEWTPEDGRNGVARDTRALTAGR